eukprot:scaffold61449_cov17-Tisochrysis_lutea.AAC.1
MSALARKEASLQGALSSASMRAEAAEKRVGQLEKEADGLAREVGVLQVRGCGLPEWATTYAHAAGEVGARRVQPLRQCAGPALAHESRKRVSKSGEKP